MADREDQGEAQLGIGKRLRLTLWVLARSLRMRWLANGLTVLAVLLGVGLALVVPMSASAFQRGAIDAANIFDLLVTAEGSQTQAVLNTIYYQDAPVGNMPYRVYESLAADERTVRAVPLAFGDNYQGFPLVGTTPDYFRLRESPDAPPYYRLAQGTVFSRRYQAVLGAQVARESGLGLGDTFEAAHGVQALIDPDFHTHEYGVVGILRPTGGPSDRAVYIDIDSVWNAHGQYGPVSGRIDAEHACVHVEGAGEALTAGATTLEPPLTKGLHTRFDTALATLEGGERGGYVRYTVPETSTYAFFSGDDLIMKVTDPTGEEIAPELVAGPDDVDGCLGILTAHVFYMAAGEYTVQLNAPGAAQVGFVVEEVEVASSEAQDEALEEHDDHGEDETAVDAEHACVHMENGPDEAKTARADPEGLLDATGGVHVRYDTALAPFGSGRGGYLTYEAEEDTEFAFYADTDAVALTLTDVNGNRLQPELFSDVIEGCEEIRSAHVFDLTEGRYLMEVSAEGELETLRFVVEEYEHEDAEGEEHEEHEEHEDEPVAIPVEGLADAPPPDGTDTREVTAVLFATERLGDLYLMASQLNEVPGVQAIFPGAVLGRLIEMLGQGRRTYGLLANVILVLAVITVGLNTYANALQAQKNLAILRAVGVSRGIVAGSVLLEAALLSVLGILLGAAVAYLGTAGVGQILSSQTGLTLPLPELSGADWLRGLALLPVALLFALLPALQAARKSPLERL